MASARSGMPLGPIQRLFDEGTLTGLTDAQLVERFLDRRDEGAFVALVARHGAMVLAVCRGVLKDPSDAEDAFQATFLVLFRKADGLKSAGSLGSWLYRVAYRIAIRANAVSKRRRERPIEEVTMAAEARSPGEGEIDRELLPSIHAEIDRLPDRYRASIVLCCLQGLSYEQAAHQLGLPLGTVGSRITRARELLRSRLVRRGVTATTAALSVLLAREATAAPAAWVETTTRAALRLGEGAGAAKAAGMVSAAVALSDHVLRRMLMIRLIQMISVLAATTMAGLAAWTSLGDGEGPKPLAPAGQAQTKRVEEPNKNETGGGPSKPIEGLVRLKGDRAAARGRPGLGLRDPAGILRHGHSWPIPPRRPAQALLLRGRRLAGRGETLPASLDNGHGHRDPCYHYHRAAEGGRRPRPAHRQGHWQAGGRADRPARHAPVEQARGCSDPLASVRAGGISDESASRSGPHPRSGRGKGPALPASPAA